MDSVIDFEAALRVLQDSGYDAVLNRECDVSGNAELPKKALAYVKSCMAKM